MTQDPLQPAETFEPEIEFDESATPEQREQAQVLTVQYKQLLTQSRSLVNQIGQEFGGIPDPQLMLMHRLESLIEEAWPVGTLERLAFETNWQRKCVSIFKQSIKNARDAREEHEAEMRRQALTQGIPGVAMPQARITQKRR